MSEIGRNVQNQTKASEINIPNRTKAFKMRQNRPNPDGRVQNLMEMPSPLVMDVSSVFLEICKVCLTRLSETKKSFGVCVKILS